MFQVPESKASIGQDQFDYEIGGKKFAIKKAKFLPIGQAEALENPESSTVVLDLFGKAGSKSGDAVRSLDSEQFQALVNAWQEDSGLAPGESAASES